MLGLSAWEMQQTNFFSKLYEMLQHLKVKIKSSLKTVNSVKNIYLLCMT